MVTLELNACMGLPYDTPRSCPWVYIILYRLRKIKQATIEMPTFSEHQNIDISEFVIFKSILKSTQLKSAIKF